MGLSMMKYVTSTYYESNLFLSNGRLNVGSNHWSLMPMMVWVKHPWTVSFIPCTSRVPRPSRAPARKRVWNLSQDFLALLNQHDDVFYVIHVLWAYGPIPMRAYT